MASPPPGSPAASPKDTPPANEESGEDSPGFCPIPLTGPVVISKGCSYPTFALPDFLEVRRLADSLDGWTLRYAKANVFSWDQPAPPSTGSKMNLVKVYATFEDIPAELMYDLLHDPEYRKVWDDAMIKGYNICQLTPNNDIGYYAVKTPMPATNRDFCNQRAWIETENNEYLIVNTSVEHPDQPKVKGLVRAWSYISGYFLRPLPSGGCSMTYLTQSNPRGWVPTSLMNSVTAKYAPNLMTKLHKAAQGYPAWKSKQAPDPKPWRIPKVAWPEPVKDLTPEWAVNFHSGNPASPITK